MLFSNIYQNNTKSILKFTTNITNNFSSPLLTSLNQLNVTFPKDESISQYSCCSIQENALEIIYFSQCSNDYFSNRIFLIKIKSDPLQIDAFTEIKFIPLLTAQTSRKNPTINIVYNKNKNYWNFLIFGGTNSENIPINTVDIYALSNLDTNPTLTFLTTTNFNPTNSTSITKYNTIQHESLQTCLFLGGICTNNPTNQFPTDKNIYYFNTTDETLYTVIATYYLDGCKTLSYINLPNRIIIFGLTDHSGENIYCTSRAICVYLDSNYNITSIGTIAIYKLLGYNTYSDFYIFNCNCFDNGGGGMLYGGFVSDKRILIDNMLYQKQTYYITINVYDNDIYILPRLNLNKYSILDNRYTNYTIKYNSATNQYLLFNYYIAEDNLSFNDFKSRNPYKIPRAYFGNPKFENDTLSTLSASPPITDNIEPTNLIANRFILISLQNKVCLFYLSGLKQFQIHVPSNTTITQNGETKIITEEDMFIFSDGTNNNDSIIFPEIGEITKNFDNYGREIPNINNNIQFINE